MSANPTDITYKELSIRDFDALKELGGQCFPLPYTDSFWINIASDAVTYYSLGAYNREKKLVGAIGVMRFVKNHLNPERIHPEEQRLISNHRKGCYTCYIATLMVAADYRKIGIATQLLQRATAKLLKEGSQMVYLHVLPSNQPAIRLYEKLGFEKVVEVPNYYTIEGVQKPGIIYCRRLADA